MALTYVCDECKESIDERLRITVDNHYLRTTHFCSDRCVIVWTAKTRYLKPTAAGADDDIERLAREIHLARIVSGATDVADWDETTDAYRTRRRIEATQLMISGYAKQPPAADEVVDAVVWQDELLVEHQDRPWVDEDGFIWRWIQNREIAGWFGTRPGATFGDAIRLDPTQFGPFAEYTGSVDG